MYEKSRAKLASKQVYRKRLINAVVTSILIISISLLISVLGYHFIGGFKWIDSFLNASMILGGMGPVDILTTNSAKVFAGFYALFSGVSFLIGIGVILTPMLHRFLHRFHLDLEEEVNTAK